MGRIVVTEYISVDGVVEAPSGVIVGAGKRLFAETTQKKSLPLVETKTFDDGIHVLIYRPPSR